MSGSMSAGYTRVARDRHDVPLGKHPPPSHVRTSRFLLLTSTSTTLVTALARLQVAIKEEEEEGEKKCRRSCLLSAGTAMQTCLGSAAGEVRCSAGGRGRCYDDVAR
ncbi:hypothetical protein GGG16DRAFT_110569 [Schizophyllum commune]